MSDQKVTGEFSKVRKKNPLTGNYSISKEDYADLTSLAKEGISSRVKIGDLLEKVKHYQEETEKNRKAFNRLQDSYDKLMEKCRPFLRGSEHFPDLVQRFIDHINSLFAEKEKEKLRGLIPTIPVDVVYQSLIYHELV